MGVRGPAATSAHEEQLASTPLSMGVADGRALASALNRGRATMPKKLTCETHRAVRSVELLRCGCGWGACVVDGAAWQELMEVHACCH